jgi:hypothetical protein
MSPPFDLDTLWIPPIYRISLLPTPHDPDVIAEDIVRRHACKVI